MAYEGIGTTGQMLQGNTSGNATWSTSTYPATNAANTLLYASSANTMGALATANGGVLVTSNAGVPSILAGSGTSGQVLQAVSGAAPAWSTPTFPSTSGSTGVILRSDGTNYVATTATYPATTTSQQVLYSSSANVIGGLAVANSGIIAYNSSGTLAARAFSVTRQVFTSNGTYTPTAGMIYCDIICIGGGGAGGGAAASGAAQFSVGGGGGAGEYAQGTFSASSIGASKAVTIGAAGTANSGSGGGTGGTTSVGSTLISAIGGTGGSTGGAGSASAGAPGAGGTGGTGGDFRTPGGAGGTGQAQTGTLNFSGSGGQNALSAGGIELVDAAGGGNPGLGYGGGGGGALSSNNGPFSGGAGVKGAVIVTEYIIA